MPVQNEKGFLQDDFLTTDFLGGSIEHYEGSQVEMKILGASDINKTQVEMAVADSDLKKSQTEMVVASSAAQKSQADMIVGTTTPVNSQVNMQVVDSDTSKAQVTMTIPSSAELGSQVSMLVQDFLSSIGGQVNLQVQGASQITGSQVTTTNILYFSCGGFLTDDFMTGDFLSAQLCAAIRSQVDMKVEELSPLGAQVEMKILDATNAQGSQVQMRIDTTTNTRSQVTMIKTEFLRSQVTIALYNINRPRILCDFDSRGTTGINWTASSTEPGDFSVLNVNNDIEEMYWRSATGIISSVTLTCDTEIAQGIFLDTLAIRSHNLTTSATLTMQGSNDAGFSPVGISVPLTVEKDNIYYVAPTLPTESFRYWRFLISDITNTDSFLSIGTIIFGNAIILNSECTTDEIIEIPREFKNSFKTEGFTSTANSRSLKNALRVNFKSIAFESGDYTKLVDAMEFARTTLKCLWMFDPSTASFRKRFTVFGKIKQIPQRRHKVKGKTDNLDHISFPLEIDESE